MAVIRKNRVRMAGRRMIGVPIVDDRPADEPQARIVEQNNRVVAVEVACPCGRRIYLELDYAAPSPPPPTPPAAPAPAAPDETRQ